MDKINIIINQIIGYLAIASSIITFFVVYFKFLGETRKDKSRFWNRLLYSLGASLFVLVAISGYQVSIPLLLAYLIMKYANKKDKEQLNR